MKKFDVVIVGCGPSGVAAAKVLLDASINFCMIDKEVFPRKKLCAGGLTLKCQKLLDELKFNYKELIKGEYSSFELRTKEKIRKLDVKEKIAMVDRVEFDNHNLKEIKKVNKNIFEGEKIIEVKDDIIKTDKNEIKYKYIIFADGINGYSRVFSKQNNLGFCVEANIKKRIDNIAISFDALKDGYAWIFPKGNNSTVGLGKFKNIKDDYKKLMCDFANHYNIKIDNKDIKGYPIPTSIIKKNIWDNKILVGDAAGLVDPISGEGIYYALLSGKSAGEVIVEKLNNKCVNMEKVYKKKMNKAYFILRYKRFISHIFYSPLKHFLIRLAYSNKLFLRLAVHLVLM